MKKILLGLAALTIAAITAGWLLPGFGKRTDVCLAGFSVSEEHSVITVETALSGSMGYIRGIETEKGQNEIHCAFYSTFGGLNSRIGAKSRFEIPIDDSVEKIYFDRGTEPDILVLERNAANVWVQR